MNARPSHLKSRRTSFALAVALLVSTGAFAQADEARAKKIAGGSCFLCHGAQGESTSEVFPRLAGQHATYVVAQLKTFGSKLRPHGVVMQQEIRQMTPAEMRPSTIEVPRVPALKLQKPSCITTVPSAR